jgi:hypothetical protein
MTTTQAVTGPSAFPGKSASKPCRKPDTAPEGDTNLAKFGASLDNVVEEVIHVTDFDAAFAIAGELRKAAYGTEQPICASTLSGATRLAFPQQLIEISFTAVLPG